MRTAPEPNDPDLSAAGIEQAKKIARRVANEKIDHLIASPFTRTLRTAHEISITTGLPIHVEWGVGEQIEPAWFAGDHYPAFPPLHERAKIFPSLQLDYKTLLVPDGFEPQNFPQIRIRAAQISKRLLERFDGNLLIVAHYAIVNVLTEALTGSLIPREIDVCSFTKLVQDGDSWHGEILADMSHIRG